MDPLLFKDVKTISIEEIDNERDLSNNVNKVEGLRQYIWRYIENTLVEGRVVGMNDRDVLIDIGFKSEGIIDRSEFDKNDLPKIGDNVEVYLEYIEDAGVTLFYRKRKADFMRRWKELNDAYNNEKIITGKIIRRIKEAL